jgi:hypothetical protein
MPLLGWENVSRDDPDYKLCVKASVAAGTVIGGVTGSMAMGTGTIPGALAGSLWGLALGYLACPYVAPAVRRKIESAMPLSDADVRSAAEAMAQYAGVKQASDALKLLALVKCTRRETRPAAGACNDPRRTAQQLLMAV